MLDDLLVNLPSNLQRHRAFWERRVVDRPLVLGMPCRTWMPRPYPLRGGGEAHDARRILPEEMDIDRLAGVGAPLPSVLDGDLVNAAGCRYPAAWLEAVAGCPIFASAYGCVAKPAVDSLAEALDRFSVADCLQSPWLEIMDALLRHAHEYTGGQLAVQQCHLRGVIDLLAAYLGEELLCTSVVDAPEELAALAERMTELHLALARWEHARRASWHDGWVSCWKLYAPGPVLDYQIDASSLFSAGIYREHFMRYDRQVLQAFPFTLIHLHSVGLQHLDTVLELEALGTVEISLDREAMPWDREAMLRRCRRVQERGKSLLISGEMSPEDFRIFTTGLDPAGLAIECWENSIIN
ncbi:MAG: hypothetical protein ACYDCO_03685 [Armatimonadota bacterium]